MPKKVQTLAITNFSGRLTRVLNGDINSGFANFENSWGYDPFSKPGNLTWMETPSSIAGIQDVIMGGLTRAASGTNAVLSNFLVGNTGKVYQIEVRNPTNLLDQGPVSPASVFLDNSVGTVTWSDPQYVEILDSSVASASFSPGSATTYYLGAFNFGFNVPSNAEVVGVTAIVYKRQSASDSVIVRDNEVHLVYSGSLFGENKASSNSWPYFGIAPVTYGGPNDLWDATFSPMAVNDPTFGFVISASKQGVNSGFAAIDYISLGVTYTLPTLDSVIGIASVATTFNYGAGMSFFGMTEKLYLGSDDRILRTGSIVGNNQMVLNGESTTVAQPSVVGNVHPLRKFAGKLVFGNGPSIGVVDSTGTVISSVFTVSNVFGNQYSQLSPPLPSDQQVRDLDTSVDANYIDISATSAPPENLTSPRGDLQVAAPSEGGVYSWNGVDAGVTRFKNVPSGTSTALQVYLENNLIFLNDAYGTSVSDGTNKLLTLPRNKSPLPNATTVNGNFLSWMAPEIEAATGGRVGSLYYFGALDEENPAGLYRLLRYFPSDDLQNGFVYQIPYNSLVTNKYETVNASISGLAAVSYGRHFFSSYNVSSVASGPTETGTHPFYSFAVTPTGLGTPVQGYYQTQTQLFSKRISVGQIRVYTEPTVQGNAFTLSLIGADGRVIENGEFVYTYGVITDSQTGQQTVERINFNTNVKTQYAVGIRVINTGTVNMTIKKIEVDYSEEGK